MARASQHITRTVVVTRTRTRRSNGSRTVTTNKPRRTKRCPACGRYI